MPAARVAQLGALLLIGLGLAWMLAITAERERDATRTFEGVRPRVGVHENSNADANGEDQPTAASATQRATDEPSPTPMPDDPPAANSAVVPSVDAAATPDTDVALPALAAATAIDVAEPSGIAWSPARQGLWVVSDGATELFLVDRSGQVLDRRPIAVDAESGDWEGIVELPSGVVIVASETGRQLLIIRPSEGIVDRSVAIASLDGGGTVELDGGGNNRGIEGVTVDAAGRVWVVKESQPSLLLELDPTLTRIVTVTDPTLAIGDALGSTATDVDLSGLTADPADADVLWLASHTGQAIVRWNTATEAIEELIPVDTPKLEGLTFDDSGTLFAVDDDTNELIVIAQ